MSRYPEQKAVTPDGWTDWVKPVMKGYRMQCCDCGLIHEMDFKVIKHGRGHKVIFRARRHNRKTVAANKKWWYQEMRRRGFKPPPNPVSIHTAVRLGAPSADDGERQ